MTFKIKDLNIWSLRLSVRTAGFHPAKGGSIPPGTATKMFYSVYMLITVDQKRIYSYVGYTNDLLKRLRLHNSSKGAKYTRGKKWTIIYKKKYKTKSLAMKEEYRLKKDVKLRSLIKNKYLNKLNA